MPDLSIRIKKKSDGGAALSCVRSDGSTTWQRQEGQLGAVFPLHDLTHLAVESVLGLDRAFYGLIADGWDISFFADPNGRGPNLPQEALVSELIVGYFDLERLTGIVEPAAIFNEKIRSYFHDRKSDRPDFLLTDAQLAQVRAVRDELFAQWKAVAPGEALELYFDRSNAGHGSRVVRHKIAGGA